MLLFPLLGDHICSNKKMYLVHAGQYAQLYQQQQQAAQQQAQLYPAPPPSYEQALGHPTLNAAQAQQHPSSAWVCLYFPVNS
jgi:hypothetical protein